MNKKEKMPPILYFAAVKANTMRQYDVAVAGSQAEAARLCLRAFVRVLSNFGSSFCFSTRVL